MMSRDCIKHLKRTLKAKPFRGQKASKRGRKKVNMSKIIIGLVVGLLMSGLAYADSLTQVTTQSGQNCQVSVIAGQTYVNC
jgi:hypothetical protein